MNIYKYPIELTERQLVAMPQGGEILSLQIQAGVPCIWAKVCPIDLIKRRQIVMYGTGWPCDTNGKFIGTIQDGPYVWHFFDEGEI